MASNSTSYAMNGGDGLHSYVRNSSLQSYGAGIAKNLINQAIAENLELKQVISSSSSSSSSPKTFTLADLGCSVGPNTFVAVQNIIESVKLKWQYSWSPKEEEEEEALEFQVFFNDLVSNDFNQLFVSLPSDRQYYAAGVPGSFRNRLFPEAAIHLVYSSFSLHWLSTIPRELVDESSPAYNKGKIYYANAPDIVVEAYSGQFAKDMESFLNARAPELACGGLMVLLILCRPELVSLSECTTLATMNILGDTLMDMVQMGLLSEAKVDSFNLPTYYPTLRELEILMRKNTCFTIEKIEEIIVPPTSRHLVLNIPIIVSHSRAALEGLLKGHFGDDMMIEELFDLFSKKLEESSLYSDPLSSWNHKPPIQTYFILLKRNYG